MPKGGRKREKDLGIQSRAHPRPQLSAVVLILLLHAASSGLAAMRDSSKGCVRRHPPRAEVGAEEAKPEGRKARTPGGDPADGRTFPTVVRGRYLMGTIFRFEVPTGDDAEWAAEALESALDEVERLEGELSNWRSGSELSRLNREAARRPVRAPPDLYRAVEAAFKWAAETGGAFDPTVEPLTRSLRSPSGTGPVLSPVTPDGRGWRGVQLDPKVRSVHFTAGVEGLDLGGIGKGYALDRAAALLERRGISTALLDAGGQVLAMGSPPGQRGWKVGVANPGDREDPVLALLLRDVSAATSGNSERPGEIFDPVSGTPVLWSGSATAITADATSADALSTALFVLGPVRGISWARRRSDLVAIYAGPGASPGGPPTIQGSVEVPSGARTTLSITSKIRNKGRVLHVRVRKARWCPRPPDFAAGPSGPS